jgi:hypothetical protein
MGFVLERGGDVDGVYASAAYQDVFFLMVAFAVLAFACSLMVTETSVHCRTRDDMCPCKDKES